MVVGVGPVGDMGLFGGGFYRFERDNSEKKREGEDQR